MPDLPPLPRLRSRASRWLLILPPLAGCYGTKPPPPLPSRLPPPGIATLTIPDRPVTLPTDLPSLIKTYRSALIAQAHPMPAEAASRWADAEIQALRKLHEGQDDQLRTAILQRLNPPAVQPVDPGQVQPALPPENDANPQGIRQ